MINEWSMGIEGRQGLDCLTNHVGIKNSILNISFELKIALWFSWKNALFFQCFFLQAKYYSVQSKYFFKLMNITKLLPRLYILFSSNRILKSSIPFSFSFMYFNWINLVWFYLVQYRRCTSNKLLQDIVIHKLTSTRYQCT